MITIIGATGHIGKRTAELLLKKGLKIRAVMRNAEKANDLKKKGADIVAGDVNDSNFLTTALRGSDAAFVMIPPNYGAPDMRADQNKTSESIVEAVKKSGVTHVISLSSIGAHLSAKAGPINGLYDHEQRLNKVDGVNVLYLRPGYFMENLLMNVGLIKNMGIVGGPLSADAKIPMIATNDIAVEVAERLGKRDFSGKTVRELMGQRDISMKEATRAIGQAIGKPDLNYVQFAYEDAEKAMVQMGLSADVARLMIEMNKGFNEGTIKPTQARGAETTTATSIEEFTRTVFAAAFKA